MTYYFDGFDAAISNPPFGGTDDNGKRKPPEMEDVTCVRCGDTYQRLVNSDARWSLCRPCISRVRQRAARLAREYVAWRHGQPAG